MKKCNDIEREPNDLCVSPDGIFKGFEKGNSIFSLQLTQFTLRLNVRKKFVIGLLVY